MKGEPAAQGSACRWGAGGEKPGGKRWLEAVVPPLQSAAEKWGAGMGVMTGEPLGSGSLQATGFGSSLGGKLWRRWTAERKRRERNICDARESWVCCLLRPHTGGPAGTGPEPLLGIKPVTSWFLEARPRSQPGHSLPAGAGGAGSRVHLENARSTNSQGGRKRGGFEARRVLRPRRCPCGLAPREEGTGPGGGD